MNDSFKKTCGFNIEKWLDGRVDDWLGRHRVHGGKGEFINRAIGHHLDALEYEEKLIGRVVRRVCDAVRAKITFEDTFYLQDDDSPGCEKVNELCERAAGIVPGEDAVREHFLYKKTLAGCLEFFTAMESGIEEPEFKPLKLDEFEKQDIAELAAVEGAFGYLTNSTDSKYGAREKAVRTFARAKLDELLASREYEDGKVLTGDVRAAVEKEYAGVV